MDTDLKTITSPDHDGYHIQTAASLWLQVALQHTYTHTHSYSHRHTQSFGNTVRHTKIMPDVTMLIMAYFAEIFRSAQGSTT